MTQNKTALVKKREGLLYRVEAGIEMPMFILALAWLYLFYVEISIGLTPFQQKLGSAIWIAFIVEFFFKFFLAPDKKDYLKHNWLIAISIFVPAMRVFRLARALRLLRFSRAIASTGKLANIVQDAQGEKPTRQMDIGIMIAHSLLADKEKLKTFVDLLSWDISEKLRPLTNIQWKFHLVEPNALESDAARRPSEFIEEAGLRMAQGPYDALLVVTDISLVSRNKTVEAGLFSTVCNIMVMSTRKLLTAPRGKPARDLLDENVRANAARLALHMIGHLARLKHDDDQSDIMAPFEFDENLTETGNFNEREQQLLKQRAERLPEYTLEDSGWFKTLLFHFFMMIRNPGDIILPLMRSGAFLLPLSLPGLATAAVAPTFLLIFTAEIWDVGVSMSNQVATLYAILSILGATYYLVSVQDLFLPRQEKRILTEHLAVANTVIFTSILMAMIGLFVMVLILMLAIEIFIFPAGLMTTWQTLEQGAIDMSDKIRLAVFISTIGVTTGALAGGLENKTVIQHIGLFDDKA